MEKCLLFIYLLFPLVLPAQIITKFAGVGTMGFSGNDTPAIAAGMPNPIGGGAFDKYGNYYFADGQANRIRKIDVAGIITTIAGTGSGTFGGDGGLATAAQLYAPQEVVLDTFGNLYICDAANFRIRKVNITTGIISTIVGTGAGGYGGDGGPATAAEIYDPQDICFDKFGNLYIADAFNYRIRKVDNAGIITTFAGNGIEGYPVDGIPATSEELDAPLGLAADDTGNIYIADAGSYSSSVRKVNTSGIITTVVGNGTSSYSGDGIPAIDAQIEPFKITIDNMNNMYISDRYNQRVYKVDTTGILYNIAGNGSAGWSGNGGIDSLAELDYPNGVRTDSCGNLYIPETGQLPPSDSGHNIRKVLFANPPTPTISISPSPNDTVCAGASVVYTANIINGIGVGYQWLVDGVVLSAATNISYAYTPANGDSVRCIIIYALKCMGGIDTVSSNTIDMVVTPATVPTIALTSSASAAIGSIVTVNATIAGAGSSYNINWYDNGVLFNTTSIPMVTYTKATGTDNITATVISTSVGCYDSTTSSVFTITVSDVGINNVAMSQMYIYPNPAHTVIIIAGQNIINVKINNLLGQTLINQDCNSDGTSINIASLPAGVYAIKVIDSNGGETINKIVKE